MRWQLWFPWTLGGGHIKQHVCRRFVTFLGILTLESFTSASLGLAVGSVAPSTEAAVAIGPAVMVVFIVFGGGASAA